MKTRTVALWIITCTLLFAGTASASSRGAGELSLDRSSVVTLLEAGMPRSVPVSLGTLGEITLELEPPSWVDFIEGGVEAAVQVNVEAIEYSSLVHVRYVPAVDRLSGVIHLEAESARPETVLPWRIDLAHLLPPVSLPRGLD